MKKTEVQRSQVICTSHPAKRQSGDSNRSVCFRVHLLTISLNPHLGFISLQLEGPGRILTGVGKWKGHLPPNRGIHSSALADGWLIAMGPSVVGSSNFTRAAKYQDFCKNLNVRSHFKANKRHFGGQTKLIQLRAAFHCLPQQKFTPFPLTGSSQAASLAPLQHFLLLSPTCRRSKKIEKNSSQVLQLVHPNTWLQWFPEELFPYPGLPELPYHLCVSVYKAYWLINSLLPTTSQSVAEKQNQVEWLQFKPVICKGYNIAVNLREKAEGRFGE